MVKNLPESRRLGSILGSGRSSGEENSYQCQYSYLENSWVEETGGLQSMALQSQTGTQLSD